MNKKGQPYNKRILEARCISDEDSATTKQPPKKKCKPDNVVKRIHNGSSSSVMLKSVKPKIEKPTTEASTKSPDNQKTREPLMSGIRLKSINDAYPKHLMGDGNVVSLSWSFAERKFTINTLLAAHNDFRKRHGQHVKVIEDFLPEKDSNGGLVTELADLCEDDELELCWSMWRKLINVYTDTDKEQSVKKAPQVKLSSKETENHTAQTPLDQPLSEGDGLTVDTTETAVDFTDGMDTQPHETTDNQMLDVLPPAVAAQSSSMGSTEVAEAQQIPTEQLEECRDSHAGQTTTLPSQEDVNKLSDQLGNCLQCRCDQHLQRKYDQLQLEVSDLNKKVKKLEESQERGRQIRHTLRNSNKCLEARVEYLGEQRRREHEILVTTNMSTVSETLKRMMTGEDTQPFVPPSETSSDFSEDEI